MTFSSLTARNVQQLSPKLVVAVYIHICMREKGFMDTRYFLHVSCENCVVSRDTLNTKHRYAHIVVVVFLFCWQMKKCCVSFLLKKLRIQYISFDVRLGPSFCFFFWLFCLIFICAIHFGLFGAKGFSLMNSFKKF